MQTLYTLRMHRIDEEYPDPKKREEKRRERADFFRGENKSMIDLDFLKERPGHGEQSF